MSFSEEGKLFHFVWNWHVTRYMRGDVPQSETVDVIGLEYFSLCEGDKAKILALEVGENYMDNDQDLWRRVK